MVPIWLARGYMTGSLLEVEELVTMVDTVIQQRRHGLDPVGDRRPPPTAPAPAEEPA